MKVVSADLAYELSVSPAGYKGYGLGMMVELMCGMLGGGMYAHHIRKWTSTEHRPADLVNSHTLPLNLLH